MENFLYAIRDAEVSRVEEEEPCYCLVVDEKGPYITARSDLSGDAGTFLRPFPLETRHYINRG